MKRTVKGLAIAFALAACDGAMERSVAEYGYVKAHDIRQLMEVVLEPQADVFWSSAGTIIDATGEHDLTPTTDEGWLMTQSAAATIAEMGNLLMTSQYAEARGEDWIQFSKSLVEIGMKAEEAAIERNADAILAIGGTMYNVCNACHQIYLPPAE